MNRINRTGRLGWGLGISLLALLLLVVPGRTAEEALTYYDNTSSSVVHTGSWTINGSGWPRAYNSSISYSNATSAKVSLNFYGNSITRIYTMASNRGLADIYIDGSFKETMNDITPAGASTARWQAAKTWTLPTGPHTIEVRRITGYVDADAFISDIPTVTNGNFDDAHTQFKYIGNWTAATGWIDAYNGTLHWSKNTEDAVTFTFTGDNISYFFTKSWNRGKVAVTIDGVDRGLIDLYSFTPAFKQVASWSGLGSGIHTIHLAVTNQKNSASTDYYVDVDMLKAGTAYNRTAAVAYADTWAHARNSNYPNYGNPSDNPCNDCTNFVSQALEAGGIPQIIDINRDDQNVWYSKLIQAGAWYVSLTWKATPEFKQHLGAFSSRFQFKGTTASAVQGLSAGDVIVMEIISNPVDGPNHASLIVAYDYPQEGDQTNVKSMLRNAHCADRKRVRWNYNLQAQDQYWAYHVTY